MDQVQPTGCFHLLHQLFSREQKQLFEQLIAAGRAKHFIMALSPPLLSQREGRGKKQRGQTQLLCSANQKWLAEHKAAPIQREGEMVPLQSSKVAVLSRWQQPETQEEARACAGITRQSQELQFLRQSKSLKAKTEVQLPWLLRWQWLRSESSHTSSKQFFFIKCNLIPPFLPIPNNICHLSLAESWKIQQI